MDAGFWEWCPFIKSSLHIMLHLQLKTLRMAKFRGVHILQVNLLTWDSLGEKALQIILLMEVSLCGMTLQFICVSSILGQILFMFAIEEVCQASVDRLNCMACTVGMMPHLTKFSCILISLFSCNLLMSSAKLLWLSSLHYALPFWSFVCLLELDWVISTWLYTKLIEKTDTDLLLWLTLNSISGNLSLRLIQWLYVCWSARSANLCAQKSHQACKLQSALRFFRPQSAGKCVKRLRRGHLQVCNSFPFICKKQLKWIINDECKTRLDMSKH